jgi:hypothetical protein
VTGGGPCPRRARSRRLLALSTSSTFALVSLLPTPAQENACHAPHLATPTISSPTRTSKMIQLLSTPTSNIPLSPPTSPAVRDAALPPDGTTPVTTFVDSPTWRPYRSHLARIVMAFPATSPTASPNPRRKSFSVGVGGGGATVDAKTAAAGKELVIDGARVTVMAVSTTPSWIASDAQR